MKESNNQGLDIILSRMESHPDEFAQDYTDNYSERKWDWFLQRVFDRVRILESEKLSRQADIDTRALSASGTPPLVPFPLPFLSDDDVYKVYNKYCQIQKGAFNRAVLDTMCNKEEKRNNLNTTVGSYKPSPTVTVTEDDEEVEEQEG